MNKIINSRRSIALLTIKRLKWPSNIAEMRRLPVLYEGETVAFLRPLTPGIKQQIEQDSILMTNWRNLESLSFFTWQEYTLDKTKQWILNGYAKDPLALIFIIENVSHQPFGMASFYNIYKKEGECEFGRLLRGNSNGPKGSMTMAVKYLCHFAMNELLINRIYLEVFEKNKKAVSFYQSCGFEKVSNFKVYPIPFDGGIKWTPVDTMPGNKFLKALGMEIKRKEGR